MLDRQTLLDAARNLDEELRKPAAQRRIPTGAWHTFDNAKCWLLQAIAVLDAQEDA